MNKKELEGYEDIYDDEDSSPIEEPYSYGE